MFSIFALCILYKNFLKFDETMSGEMVVGESVTALTIVFP